MENIAYFIAYECSPIVNPYAYFRLKQSFNFDELVKKFQKSCLAFLR